MGSTGNGGPIVTLVEQWNGASWVIVPSPNHNDNSSWLLGVSCPTTTACTAVGDSATSGTSLRQIMLVEQHS